VNSGLRTRYDYDPWGRRVNVNGGGVEADFGFTGHYYHAASSLHLARYRSYSGELGRWLSRDSIESAEMMQGPNLYAYVQNDPLAEVDSDGRFAWVPVCCLAAFGFAAYDLYKAVKDKTCAGYTGNELVECYLKKALKNDLAACLAAAISTAKSPKEAAEKAGDCFKCEGWHAAKDIGKAISIGCCLGGIIGKIVGGAFGVGFDPTPVPASA